MKDGGDAFPIPKDPEWRGMNLREFMATAALQGLLAGRKFDVKDGVHQKVAKEAVEFADALLSQLGSK